MEPKILYKIYEMKGIITSLVTLVNEDEQYNYPMIETLETSINEIVNLIENNA